MGLRFGTGSTQTARLGPGAILLVAGTRLRVRLSLNAGEGIRLSCRPKRARSVPRRSKDLFVAIIREPGNRGPGNRKRWRPLPTDSYAGYRLFH